MTHLESIAPANLILADPPWSYDINPGKKRDIATKQYATLSINEIINLQPNSQDNAILLLWTTTYLKQALAVMEGWGFRYITNMVWIKPSIGMGYYSRQQHELLLIGKKGTPRAPLPANRPSSIIHGPRRRHSQKPDEAYEAIERMFPHLTDRLEMFARNTRPGWTSWGNEVPENTA